jgi:hypothetical protein
MHIHFTAAHHQKNKHGTTKETTAVQNPVLGPARLLSTRYQLIKVLMLPSCRKQCKHNVNQQPVQQGVLPITYVHKPFSLQQQSLQLS